MKFSYTPVSQGSIILYNNHFVSKNYDCSEVTATDGVIPAGTVVPANDATAIGVLLNDVYPDENSNGTIVIHGFVNSDNMPEAASAEAEAALTQITFISEEVE